MKRLGVILLLLALLGTPCFAAALPDALDVGAVEEALPADAAEALQGESADNAELDSGIEKILDFVRGHFRAALSEAAAPTAAVAAITVLCAAGESFIGKSSGFDYVSFGGCLAVIAATVSDVRSVISMGSETVGELAEFSRVLLSTLATAAAAAGAVGSAAAKYAAAAMFSDILLTAAQNLILPLICAYTAAVAAGAALGTSHLSAAVKLLQWSAKTLLKGLVIVFTAYLSVTGVIASGADAAAVKAAKAVLSTALPVVGRTISDASESLVAGAALLRNAIGEFGLLAVLAAVALPVLRLLLRYLLYKAAAAVTCTVAGDRLGGLIEGIGSAYGLVLGLVGTAAVFEFLSIFSFLRTVTG